MPVRVVTDSTTCLTPALRAAHPRLGVVPLDVVIDGVARMDGGPDVAGPVVAALKEGRKVTTSRPSPAAFATTLRAAAQEPGCEGIVSLHLSSALSATWEGAVVAARELTERTGVPVEVVDTRVIGMAGGFAALAADGVACVGGSMAEVASVARAVAFGASTYFCVDSLDYLRRGGRMGGAAAIIGTALSVKPILTVRDGRVVVRDRVRTRSRALDKMVSLAVADARLLQAGGAELAVAVQQLEAGEAVDRLLERLATELPGCEPVVTELGAVVGTHTGPGTVSVCVAPAGTEPSAVESLVSLAASSPQPSSAPAPSRPSALSLDPPLTLEPPRPADGAPAQREEPQAP